MKFKLNLKLKPSVALIAFSAILTPSNLYAQDAKAQKLSVKSLLQVGFQVKSAEFIKTGMIVTMQRGTLAYICETDQNGKSKLCIEFD